MEAVSVGPCMVKVGSIRATAVLPRSHVGPSRVVGPSGPQFHLIAADSLARHCELSNEWRTRSDCYEISCDRPEIMFLMFFGVDQCDDDIY